MTSFTPPIAALPGDPVALKEELLGNIEGELAQEPCLGYLRTWQTEPCISACPPGGRVPAKKDLGGLGRGELQEEPILLLPVYLGISVLTNGHRSP